MASVTSPSVLTGLFKETYGSEIQSLIPESAKLIKMISFIEREKQLGNQYHQPLIVAAEQGVTYAANNAGAFALNSSIAMNMQDATVVGSQVLLRSALSYDAASRSSNSKAAFVKGTELLVESMMESITKRIEISMLHGQVGIGVKASSANVDSTHTVITISDASFAAGIWAGQENAQLQFYLVSSDALVSSSTDSIFSVDSINIDNKSITVSGSATGITALDASASCNIYFNTAHATEMAGLAKIINNSGTLFGVNAATYNLWKGNAVSLTGQLSFGKVLSAIGKAVQRGLNEKVVLLVNPLTWANLASDLAALRKFDGSYSKNKAENGFENLTYFGQSGEIEIISHNLVKEGEAFVFPPKRCKRIGSQEISFVTPGMSGDIFLHLPNNAGYEMRVYADYSLFVETPARCVYMSGFTNS